jgi:hypothetical protein
MRRRLRLTRSITAKVTQLDYEKLEALAGEQGVSQWARAVLLREAAGPDPAQVALMAALQSLRYVLFNGLPWLAPDHLRATDNKPHEVLVAENVFRRLMQEAEQRGPEKAVALLSAAGR